MRWLICVMILLSVVACHKDGDSGPQDVMSLGVCQARDVLVGCIGNTWPECADSCPPLDIDWMELGHQCDDVRDEDDPWVGTQCNCLTGECHVCEWGVTCRCDASGTFCNP